MDIGELKGKLERGELSYEELALLGEKQLIYLIQQIDSFYAEDLFYLLKGNNNKVMGILLDKDPSLADLFKENEFIKYDKFVRRAAKLYPDFLLKYGKNIQSKYIVEILEGLKVRANSFRFLNKDLMLKYPLEVIEIMDIHVNTIKYIPKEILRKKPDVVINILKRKKALLEYIPDFIQNKFKDTVIEYVKEDYRLYDFLASKIKKENKDLFYDSLLKKYPNLTFKQLSIAYKIALHDGSFIRNLKDYMLDKRLINVLGVKVLEKLIEDSDVQDVIGELYEDNEKFICFIELLKLFKDDSYIETRIIWLANLLKKDISYFSTNEVMHNYNYSQIVESVGFVSLTKYVADLVRKRKLSDVGRKRFLYILLKGNNYLLKDGIEIFDKYDEVKLNLFEKMLDSSDLTIYEAKNILFELNFGLDYEQAKSLLNKFVTDLDELYSFYDKSRLKLEELEEKQWLISLLKIREYMHLNDIETLRKEIELSLVIYKGEEKIYDISLNIEEQLKQIYNKKYIKLLNIEPSYVTKELIKYDEIISKKFQKKKYLGKTLEVRKVNSNKSFNSLLFVDYREDKEPLNNEDSWKERWQNSNNHILACSQISDNYWGMYPIISKKTGKKRCIYRFSDLNEKMIISRAPYDLGYLNSNNLDNALKDAIYYINNGNVVNCRSNLNNVLIEAKCQNMTRRLPSCVVVMDQIDQNSLEAAIDLEIPLEIYNREEFINSNLLKSENLFEQFKENISENNINGEKLKKALDILFTLRAGNLENSCEDITLKINYYLEFVLKIIENFIKENKREEAKELLELLKLIIRQEQQKVNMVKKTGRFKQDMVYDFKNVLRAINRFERKLGLSTSNEIYNSEILSYLDNSLEENNRAFNKIWFDSGIQFTFEEILPLIDKDYINYMLQIIYDSGLYSSLETHAIGHIERCAIYASILGNLLNLPTDVIKLAIISSMFHDSGRINEITDKHGDYSAAIARSYLNNMNDFTKEEINIVCAAIDFHDEDNSSFENLRLFQKKYRIKDNSRLVIVAHILRDADALDRTRFVGAWRLDVRYLYFDQSLKLVKFASSLNEREALERLNKLILKNVIKWSYLKDKLSEGNVPQEILQEVLRVYELDM